MIERRKADALRSISSNIDVTIQALRAITKKPQWNRAKPPALPPDSDTFAFEDARVDSKKGWHKQVLV